VYCLYVARVVMCCPIEAFSCQCLYVRKYVQTGHERMANRLRLETEQGKVIAVCSQRIAAHRHNMYDGTCKSQTNFLIIIYYYVSIIMIWIVYPFVLPSVHRGVCVNVILYQCWSHSSSSAKTLERYKIEYLSTAGKV